MTKYSVTNVSVETLLVDAKEGRMAVPELQRPFVWGSSKVCDLIDSLYNNYPIGYIITYTSSKVRTKDGITSKWRTLLIDGQQRFIALSTALIKAEIVTKDYKKERIAISFNPIGEREEGKEEEKVVFKERNIKTEHDKKWIADIADAMDAGRNFVNEYLIRNGIDLTGDEADKIGDRIDQLKQIKNAVIGRITLDETWPIETVQEIFKRINSTGVPLSQADFIMSRISIYEKDGVDGYGSLLWKYINYFCQLSKRPDLHSQIEENDKAFVNSPYWNKIKWLAFDDNKTYIPEYIDVLRVLSVVEFNRGKLADLSSLLEGRDFERRVYKSEIADESFRLLEVGLDKFTKEANFKHFVQDILLNLQLRDHKFSCNAISYAYAMYLRGKDLGVPGAKLKSLIKRLLFLILLTKHLSSSIEGIWTNDFQQIVKAEALEEFVLTLERQELSEVFWTDILPSEFGKTKGICWDFFILAQKFLGNQSFLTTTLVRNMEKAERHHIFPKAYLNEKGISRDIHNSLANYVYLHDQVNKKIRDRSPEIYMKDVLEFTGAYDNDIKNLDALQTNLRDNAIPDIVMSGNAENYLFFLEERKKLMAMKVREFYYKL
ncbi:MAG: DUF262 domain-containing protein [Christensenellaceae bacterium]|jgi:hypothetical protein|nr:DUF262 domain-containing protein [Christensenellaceae bacterium]